MDWNEYCKSYAEKIKSVYKRRMNKELDLENPKTFTEKLQWLKVYDSSFLKTYCTDKITIHEYVKNKLGKDICIPILKIYNSSDEINLSELPKSFVMKCNHGSGMNIIVKNKDKFILDKNKLDYWMSKDFSIANGYELHYKNIPHKIFVEEYKENAGHEDLTDYKFYCLNGKPIFCQVVEDRTNSKTITHFSNGWKYDSMYDRIEYKANPNIKCPSKYEEMISYAKKLSEDFRFVRVDFYEINNEVYLGELTFTPNSGYHKFANKDTDLKLGKMLKL